MAEIVYNDRALINLGNEIAERWPKRAKWATQEAIQMSGGHYREKLRKFIESGGSGWRPLSVPNLNGKGPLFGLGKLVRFRFTGGQSPRARIGFSTETKKEYLGRLRNADRSAWKSRKASLFTKRETMRFRAGFGMSSAQLAMKHEFGQTVAISDAMRGRLHGMGIHLKSGKTTIQVPARPMFGPFWERERDGIPEYVRRRFWEKMESKGGTFK